MTNITQHLSPNDNNDYPPFMNELEILAIVTTLRLFSEPISVLEWGSGNSTLYFPKLMPSGSEWDSIEHNSEWANRGKDLLEKAGHSNIRIHYISTNKHFQENLLDGDFETFRDYILYPEKLRRIFQLIFVDGRARVECMKAGWNLLDNNGIMILHDAQRREYDQGIPEECYWMRIVNPLINIEGNLSTLFMSKSLSMMTQLQQEIKTVLPKHIVISNNMPIFQPVFCDKDAMQSQDIIVRKTETDHAGKTSENNEIQYPKEFEQLIPHIFVVETVLGCNLKCPECAIGGDLIKRKKGWMPFEQFKVIADKIRPFCKNVLLINWGEPMLNKDIFKIIEYASSFTQTTISTNGQFFNEETAEMLILSGITFLIVSIDGVSQEVYEKYRVGGNVQKALWSLKTLNDFNVKHGRKVAIIPQFVVFKHNQHEIALFREFCHSIGLEPSFKAPYIRTNSRYENADRPEYVGHQCPDVSSLKQAMKDCSSPRQDFTIFLDGTCVMCCHDHNGITNYGNIYQQEVLEIWNNPIYKKDRWDILTGNATTYCVENCLWMTLKKQSCLFLNWENTKILSLIKLYAGDIADIKHHGDVIGLSLTNSDERHIKHDITHPMPLPDNSVDSYQAEDVFEHIPYDRLVSVVNEIFRVLKPGGVFRLSVPDYGCDVLRERSVKNTFGEIVFDPGGGGTKEDPGHVWFPRIDTVRNLIERTEFGRHGTVNYLHYYRMDDSFVAKPVDYSKGHIDRTPDFDERVKAPYRPMSMIIDLVKVPVPAPETESSVSVLPGPPQQAKAVKGQPQLCVFLNTYYGAFLNSHYTRQPKLSGDGYAEQKKALQETFFGDSDFYSSGLVKAGWRAEDLIINCLPLQMAWASENGFTGTDAEIVIEQLRRLRPDVVYLQDLSVATCEFLELIRPHTTLIVGQIASPLPAQAFVEGFDIIISSFPHFVKRFRDMGVTSYYQPLAFDPRVLMCIDTSRRNIGVSFVGGISGVHGKGTQLLEYLASTTPIEFWGYGALSLPSNSPIHARHRGDVWGREMFQTLARSAITINRHIDVAENFANNMRLFEATGCGALLITDYKDNLSELFDIGKEVVAYRSPEECATLVKYYLDHPDEAQQIAKAGQARIHRDHTYEKRMKHTAELMERHLRYKGESARLGAPDLQNISTGFASLQKTQVTDAMLAGWQDENIPRKQRALVQQQLDEMYKGKPQVIYQVLAEILRPYIYLECPILEIGCASGYYYEILEYMLGKRIAYTGADYSEPLIKMARDYYHNADFHATDGAHLPFEDKQFDIAISSGVLLHVPNFPEHVKEAVRVSSNLVVAHRTPVCRQRPTQFYSKMAYGVETFEMRFNEDEIVSTFTSNGLDLIKAFEYETNPDHDVFDLTYLFKRKGY